MAGRPPVLPSGNFLIQRISSICWIQWAIGLNLSLARVLDILFILHAEHEMNCSTAAARTSSSYSIVGRDPLIEVAVALEKAALSDEYFVNRKLYPNVDFYSGLIYR